MSGPAIGAPYAIEVLGRLRTWLSTPRAPLILHLVILGLGLIGYLVAATRLWLWYDDWSFIVDDPMVMWTPHSGHWSTIPYLVFRAILAGFGIDHYLPFAVPVTLAHLVLCHLTWRLMRRVGVAPWTATTFSLLLVFLGAGAENLDWAFQIGFIGAMAAMLGVFLLVLRTPRRWLVDIAIVVLTLLAEASSGTALPLILVALIMSWVRRGFLRTVALFAVPGVAYVAWYLVIGRIRPPGSTDAGSHGIYGAGQFSIEMLTTGLGKAFPVAAAGGVIMLALAVWWVFAIRRVDPRELPAFVYFLAAPVFALATGFSRAGFGLETASSSRYVYFVVFATVPLMALGYQRILARTRAPLVPALALVVIVAVFNAVLIPAEFATRQARVLATKSHLSAAAVLIDAHPGRYRSTLHPYWTWSPDMTVGDLESLLRRGQFHPSSFSRTDTLSEYGLLDLTWGTTPRPADLRGCRAVEPDDVPAREFDESVAVRVAADTAMQVQVLDGSDAGDGVHVGAAAGTWTRIELDHHRGLKLRIVPTTDITICDVG